MDNMAMGVDNPQEDEWALCNLGLPSPYFTILFPNQPPQDPEYLDLRQVPAAGRERWKRRLDWFLRCLTIQNPRRIVLKTPLHTARVRTLLEAFPGCRFVHIVRNPLVIFPSTVHTWRKMYMDQGVQVPRYAGLEEYVLATFSRMYAAFEEDVGTIPAGRYCEVRYEDLIRDPVGQMQAVYSQLALGDFEPARPGIERYAAQTADYQTSRYEIAEELRQAIRDRWAGYIEKYGYTDQASGDS
jgi:hypothetical protein